MNDVYSPKHEPTMTPARITMWVKFLASEARATARPDSIVITVNSNNLFTPLRSDIELAMTLDTREMPFNIMKRLTALSIVMICRDALIKCCTKDKEPKLIKPLATQ